MDTCHDEINFAALPNMPEKIRYIACLIFFRFQIMWTERILIIISRKKVMHHCTVLMHVIVESMIATFANILKKITTSYMSNTY